MNEEEKKIIEHETTRLLGVSIIEDVFDETPTPDPNEYGLEDIKDENAVYIMNFTTGKKIAKVVYKKEITRELFHPDIAGEMLEKLEKLVDVLKK